MSGTSILEDGKSYLEDYGHDLDELSEGDSVGVMRSSNGELHFFVNGIDQGVSAHHVTGTVYAVIDMYGKCAQVTIVDHEDESNYQFSFLILFASIIFIDYKYFLS